MTEKTQTDEPKSEGFFDRLRAASALIGSPRPRGTLDIHFKGGECMTLTGVNGLPTIDSAKGMMWMVGSRAIWVNAENVLFMEYR